MEDSMRYLIIVKATAETDGGVTPTDALIAQMACFREERSKPGAPVDASGLKSSSEGWRVRYHGDRREVIDGPFTDGKELLGGYTLIQARSREEALIWTRRFLNLSGDGLPAEIEVRPL
jgi:hypothetical protein